MTQRSVVGSFPWTITPALVSESVERASWVSSLLGVVTTSQCKNNKSEIAAMFCVYATYNL